MMRIFKNKLIRSLFFVALLVCTGCTANVEKKQSNQCSFFDAEYVPNWKTKPSQDTVGYNYKITVEPNTRSDGPTDPLKAFFVLHIFDRATGKLETKFKMGYSVAISSTVWMALDLSEKQHIDAVFLDENFHAMTGPYGSRKAAYVIVLPKASNKFQSINWKYVDPANIKYFSGKKIKPDMPVGDTLQLIPEVWIIDKCHPDRAR